MATSARLHDPAPTHNHAPGDFLEDFGHGRSVKLRLTSCPLCATDPHRPPYRFGEKESRADHFRSAHGPADV